MGRIRTVKPELFTSEGLYDLEIETGLPIRISFIGMFCQSDREGRFKWRPRTLKTQILPYDDLDFSRVLDALLSRGYLVSYEIKGEKYGAIPKFLQHQFINNKEQPSFLPAPEIVNNNSTLTRGEREGNASLSRGVKEGKGKERKVTANTNPKEDPMTKLSPPPNKENGTSKRRVNAGKLKSSNYKSLKTEIEQRNFVNAYVKDLEPEEQQLFYSGAYSLNGFGNPMPNRNSIVEQRLLVKWYDQTVAEGGKGL